jgi:hypothetical protein
MTHKKGQITLFILVGIILLLSFSVYVYIKNRTVEEAFKEPILEEVPTELQPVYSYVDECVTKVAVEGLKKMGQQGGYVDIGNWGISTSSVEPTNADGLMFSPGSSLKIPYWWYLKSDNACEEMCEFTQKRPSLYRKMGEPSIEGQLDNYVNEHLEDCLRDFKFFRDKGFNIKKLGVVSTTTNVAEDDVTFYVEYPLEIEKETKQKISKFFVRIPIDLKTIYEQATVLTNLEAEYRYLERDILNLIVGFSGVDEDRLPPMSDTEFKFGRGVFWKKSEVKQKIIDILSTYIQFLQVYGAHNYKPRVFLDNRLKESLYNEGMLVPSNESYKNLDVSFDYQGWWPIYFELNCEGELCQPDSGSSSFLPLLGIQRYNFAYDVSFPVLVEIHDPYALNNEGYSFMFFLEANIRNNQPLVEKFEPLEVAAVIRRSMLCDLDKRNSGEVTINIKDKATDKHLDGVKVSYSCAGESCFIGVTKGGVLKEKLPVCLGGVVTYLKEDYLTYYQTLSTKLDEENSLSVALEPFRYKKFEVRKKRVVKTADGWKFNNNPVDLDIEEQATITLKRKGTINEEEFQTIGEYKGNQTEPSEIKILPGRYDINIQLLSDKKIVIPEQTRKVGSWWNEQEYTIPKTEFNGSFPSGGLKIEYTFTADDLGKDKIVLYAVSPDIAGIPESSRVIEDLEQISKVDEYSLIYSSALKPTFE